MSGNVSPSACASLDGISEFLSMVLAADWSFQEYIWQSPKWQPIRSAYTLTYLM